MPPSNGLDTLVADPQFKSLAPADQRKALAGVSGDDTFSTLNDADTTRFLSMYSGAEPVNRQTTPAGTFQTQPGGPTYNVNTLGTTPLIPPPGISPGTASKARAALPGFPQQVKEEEAGALPGVGAIAGSPLGPEGMALGAFAGEMSKPFVRGGKADINAAGNEALAAAIFGKVAEGVGWLMGGRGASVEGATKLYQRAVTPGGTSAIEEAALKDDFARAARYIAPETRGVALQSDKGLMNASQVASDAAEKLWYQRVEPTINRYGQVPSPGSPVADAIRASITDTDRVTRPGVVKATEALADAWDRPMTVQEQAGIVRQLNNEKSVARFYRMTPAEQTAAELGDPAIRGKVVGLNSMRGTMFDTIGRAGGPELQSGFMEARKDWGALNSVSQMLQDATSPAPSGTVDKIGQGLRATWRPDTWGRVLGVDNPNTLAARSFNMLGRTEIGPPPLLAPPPPQTAGALPAAHPPLVTPLPGNLSAEASYVRGVPAQPSPLAETRQLGPATSLQTPPPSPISAHEAELQSIEDFQRSLRDSLKLPYKPPPVGTGPGPTDLGGPAANELKKFGIAGAGITAAKLRDIETAIRGPRYRSMMPDEKEEYLRKLIGSPGLRKPPG